MQIDLHTFSLYLNEVKDFLLNGAGPDAARYVRIKHDNQHLSLTATNLVTTVTLQISNESVKNQQDIDVLLDFVRIKTFIGNLATNDVAIEDKGAKVTLKSGRRRAELSTYPIANYPRIRELDKENIILDLELELASFVDAVSRTAFVGALSSVMSEIQQGLFLEIEDGVATLVSTDGNSMSAFDLDLDDESKQSAKILLPAKASLDAVALLNKIAYDEKLHIVSDGNIFQMAVSNASISIITSGQQFVDYKNLLHQKLSNYPIRLEVPVKPFTNAITYMAASNATVQMSVGTGEQLIHLNNHEFQTGDKAYDAIEPINLNVTKDIEIGLSAVYLLSFFKALVRAKTKSVTMYIQDATKPIYIIDNDNPASTIVLAAKSF